jgi:hypothetical protein
MLSILSYELIEKKTKNIFKNNNIIIVFIHFPAIIIISIYQYSNCQLKNSKSTTTSGTSIKCIDNNNHPIESCYFGENKRENIDILLVGDSHSNSQSGMIDIFAKDANMKGYEITHSSTAYLLNLDRYTINNKTKEIQKEDNFYNINKFIEKHIDNNNFKYVVMGGYFPHNWERSIYSRKKIVLSTNQSQRFFYWG